MGSRKGGASAPPFQNRGEKCGPSVSIEFPPTAQREHPPGLHEAGRQEIGCTCRRFRYPLWSHGPVPVDPAASKEAVMHHALDEEKSDDCEDDYKQERTNPDPG